MINRLNNNSVEIELISNSERKTNMVRIPGGNTRLFVSELGDLNVINLKPYWIDQFEVTNSNYQKFVDENFLSMMKDNSVLINTARGALVNEDALYHEISSNRLRAAFDVFWEEPYNGKLKKFHPNLPVGLSSSI